MAKVIANDDSDKVQIKKQKPYQAFLIDGNRIVLGTLPNGEFALCLN